MRLYVISTVINKHKKLAEVPGLLIVTTAVYPRLVLTHEFWWSVARGFPKFLANLVYNKVNKYIYTNMKKRVFLYMCGLLKI